MKFLNAAIFSFVFLASAWGQPTNQAWLNASKLAIGSVPAGRLGTNDAVASDDWILVRKGNKTMWADPAGISIGGVGTVTSVAMTVPSVFSLSGSPITTSGTLAMTGANATGFMKDTAGTLSWTLDLSAATALNASSLSSGTVPTARLGSGSATSSTFLRGDQTWAAAGAGTVTSVGLSLPSGLSVAGSPVTTSGTLAITAANTAGFWKNDGSGGTSWTTNLSGAGNLGEVSSVCIPMGAWFTNNVADGASISGATSISVTNTSDGYAFADSVTNAMRSRFSLPWDWDASTVKVEIQALCTGTNSGPGGATNVVFAVRAAANGLNESAQQPTFGTAIWTTNHFGIGAYTNYVAVTTALTVGNTPAAAKSIIWEIQRLGAQAGDTETNVSMCITEVKIYYQKNTRLDYPASTL